MYNAIRSPFARKSGDQALRVGVIGLLHESNTFVGRTTTLDDFEHNLLAEGEAVRARLNGAHHEIDGFFRGLAAEGMEAVPIFAARAFPFGVVSAGAYDTLLTRMDAAIERAGAIDGLLVAPHGATVAEGCVDVDGHWVSRLRQRFGPGIVIIATLDLHANVSRALVDACDALIAYRSNPHLDQRARGVEAARLMARTLRGEIRPTMAAEFIPLAVNIERQATDEEPCRSVYGLADEILERPGVVADSFLLGFPYADVPQMGATAIVVTNRDLAGARRQAAELAAMCWSRRSDFDGTFIGVDEAVDQCGRLDGTVCLLDMGDNVGGGSPGDGTILAHALHRRATGPALVCLYDPESVREAERAEPGDRLHLKVGGKTDRLHGAPLESEFVFVGRFDGRFNEPNARHGGFNEFDQGPTVIVATDQGLTVMLTSRRMAPLSINQLTSCAVDPAAFRVLVAKGVHSPVAAYAPVCNHLIRVDTPGVTSADLRRFTYRHRRPMYPFEPEIVWTPMPTE